MNWTITDYLKEDFREILEANSKKENGKRILTEDIEDIIIELTKKVVMRLNQVFDNLAK